MRSVTVMIFLSLFAPQTAFAQRGIDPKLPLAEQIIAYVPTRRDGVSDAKFERAKNILDETRQAVNGDPHRLNASDYWNVASAFILLDEPSDAVARVFNSATESDPITICGYIAAMGAGSLERVIPSTVIPFQAHCSKTVAEKSSFNTIDYAQKNKLDLKLINSIVDIDEKDQRYRRGSVVNMSLQRPLDAQNQTAIRTMFRLYGEYIGRDLVGKKLEAVMWAVVQHSDIQMMREYLPIVHQAVTAKQLELTPLKMLIDRIQSIETGKQIFGSQVGIPLADEPIRTAVKARYGISAG